MSELDIRPLTPGRWKDIVDLFERPGPKGAWARTGACYCMFWRLPSRDYEEAFRKRSLDNETGGPNKERMADIVRGGPAPGLLAYRDGQAVGWVSVSPRSDLVRLAESPGLRTGGDSGEEETWSIACFYVHRSARRTRVGTELLAAAVARAADEGATAIEAYPVRAGSVDPYTGYDTMFRQSGFGVVKQGRGKGRSLYRRELRKPRT